MIEKTMQMEQVDLMIAVFGAFDENIKLIERELGVSIISRQTELKISGAGSDCPFGDGTPRRCGWCPERSICHWTGAGKTRA